MSLRNFPYISAMNLNGLGDFEMNYKNPLHETVINSSLFSVLRVNKIKYLHDEREVDAYELETGFLDPKRDFFSCPFSVNYVSFCSIIQFEKMNGIYSNGTTVLFKLDVYNKDYKENISINFEISNPTGVHLDFMIANKYINFLNLYIHNNNDLQEIDIQRLKKGQFHLMSISWYIRKVLDLEFKFVRHSQNRVGKDNHFWTETIVSNLPDDKYFKNLIMENLKSSRDSSYGYSPTETSFIFEDKNESDAIKDELLNSTIAILDLKKQLFERMKKNE